MIQGLQMGARVIQAFSKHLAGYLEGESGLVTEGQVLPLRHDATGTEVASAGANMIAGAYAGIVGRRTRGDAFYKDPPVLSRLLNRSDSRLPVVTSVTSTPSQGELWASLESRAGASRGAR